MVLAADGPSDYHGLLKVLYLANREAIGTTGKPILGGEMKALEFGPLHSEVYDLLRRPSLSPNWDRLFEKYAGYHLRVRDGADPGRLDLSPLEVELLERWAAWAVGKNFEEITDYTHELAEWKRAYRGADGGRRAYTIPAESIMNAVGFSDDDAAEAIREQQAHDRFLELVAE